MAIYVGNKRYAPYIGDKRRGYMGGGGGYPADAIMTIETNPEVLAICYAQGWCASPDYMTYGEAESVTAIGTAFKNSGITHFEEFAYFTSVKQIPNDCFQNNVISCIILPGSITDLKAYGLRYGSYQRVVLSEGIALTLAWQVFYNCNATYIELPSTMNSMPNVCLANLNYDKHILLNGNAVKSCSSQSYYTGGTRNRIFVYVPDSLVSTYKATQSWIDNFNIDCILPASQYSVSAQT